MADEVKALWRQYLLSLQRHPLRTKVRIFLNDPSNAVGFSMWFMWSIDTAMMSYFVSRIGKVVGVYAPICAHEFWESFFV
jgi:hypothetical protein